MAGLNHCTIIGNLGADPELRYTSGQGTAVCELRVGVTERLAEGKKRTEWFTVVTFKGHAEAAARYLRKGRQVFVAGRIRTKKWKDKETGAPRERVELVADDVQFLGSAPSTDEG